MWASHARTHTSEVYTLIHASTHTPEVYTLIHASTHTPEVLLLVVGGAVVRADGRGGEKWRGFAAPTHHAPPSLLLLVGGQPKLRPPAPPRSMLLLLVAQLIPVNKKLSILDRGMYPRSTEINIITQKSVS